jgi:ribosomal protein S12 methylthiotransferase accessory factor
MSALADAPVIRRRAGLERLLGAWDELVDPRVGIVQEVTELVADDDDPNFFHYLSKACDTSAFTRLANFANNGGVSTDRYVAVAKAVGEAVERYCSAIFDYRDLVLAPFTELDGRATPPGDYALYLPEQYAQALIPWRPFSEDAPVCWTRGRSLADGDDVYVPAAMTYVPYHYLSSRPDTPITQPISTGLACGAGFAEAALSGLCEAIERDAFTITWQARLARPRIDQSALAPELADLLARYAAVGLRVEVMDITTDIGVPTVLTFAVGERPAAPALTVAAAADPSPVRALVKSLEELAHTRAYQRQVMAYTPNVPVEPEIEHPGVQDQRTHLRFYCEQGRKGLAEFAWSSDEVRRLDELPDLSAPTAEQELAALVARLTACGVEPIACDLTTPDVGGLGLAVVRAVVPGLHPLFMGHRNRARGGRRLYEVPQRLGYAGLRPGEPGNPYPHPFP